MTQNCCIVVFCNYELAILGGHEFLLSIAFVLSSPTVSYLYDLVPTFVISYQLSFLHQVLICTNFFIYYHIAIIEIIHDSHRSSYQKAIVDVVESRSKPSQLLWQMEDYKNH